MNSVQRKQPLDPVNLGKNIRNLNWFINAFEKFQNSMEPLVGKRFALDQDKLRLVYFDWIELFESDAVQQYSEENYWDCVDYIAGMGLTGLIAENPLSETGEEFVPSQIDRKALIERFGLSEEYSEELPEIIDFWPEGFIYVCYCISFINSLKRYKQGTVVRLDDEVFSQSFWWSFRENAQEDRKSVMYFFDRILGNKPSSSLSNSLPLRKSRDSDSYFIRVSGENDKSLPDDSTKN